MHVSDIFGIRLSEDEVRQVVADHLKERGYLIRPEDISIVPLTSSKVEFVIRQYKQTVP